MRTTATMGIKSVAVYSRADRDAKHVSVADEAISVGGSTAAEGYLLADNIIQACQHSGAQAVHPGYGFLSENAAFARKLAQAGIVFIGPGAKAIEAMGDKIASKRLAEQAGVNIIPGHDEVVPDAQDAVAIADRIGYPVMIKASAGGGGKGMRVAYNRAQCLDGFERAASEAISSFGDGRILIEKYIERPRHIEIQVMADSHGNVVTLNERECSIQRRHQKVIEEAPSAFMDDKTRAAMSAQAVALVRAVDYRSAGTVEFIVDVDRNFYFLEMNTRLQVEHPVTEFITGLDLVELMIRVAYGEKLPIAQEQVVINGWSMESRIYAESPLRNFLPSAGRLTRYQAPEQGECVRVDAGVEEGSVISRFYDPMIAKLVTWGASREAAITSMQQALAQYYIRGVDSNLPFVADIMHHPRFQAGNLTTDFIAEEYPDGFVPSPLRGQKRDNLVCVMASLHHRLVRRAATVSNPVPGYGRNLQSDWEVVIGRNNFHTRVQGEDGKWNVVLNGQSCQVEDNWLPIQTVYQGAVNAQQVCLQIEKNGYGYDVSHSGNLLSVHVFTPRTAELHRKMPSKQSVDQSRFLLSPMPGLLVTLSAAPGQVVKAGEELAVIEAMKMENSLRAENDGVISAVLVAAGATLEVDQAILEFALDG